MSAAAKQIYDPKQDLRFQEPFIDVDEPRERVLEGNHILYRHIHGGFTGTTVKFLFCFPEKEQFKGRFYQYLSPFPGTNEENASLAQYGEDDRIAFALQNGAYFVESNMGSVRAFGGSDGGYRTLACAENTQAWDGAAPYVIGNPVSLPNTLCLHEQGQRALRHVFGKIVDAPDTENLFTQVNNISRARIVAEV